MKTSWRPSATFALALLAATFACGCSTTPPRPVPKQLSQFDEFERSASKVKPKPTKIKHASKAPRAPAVAAALGAEEVTAAGAVFPAHERAEYKVRFLDVSAGRLTLLTLPDCRFRAELETQGLFSLFFKLQDKVDLTYDCHKLRPLTVELHTREKEQVREIRALYDWNRREMNMWEHSLEGDEPVKKRAQSWPLELGSQSVYSVITFVRAAALEPGRQLRFPLSHEGKTVEGTFEVVGRETLETNVGQRVAFHLRASPELTAAFAKADQSVPLEAWVSDDSERLLLKLIAPLKWGHLIATLDSYVRDEVK